MTSAFGSQNMNVEFEMAALRKEKKYNISVIGKSYSVILHPDTEDGGYWVECQSLS